MLVDGAKWITSSKVGNPKDSRYFRRYLEAVRKYKDYRNFAAVPEFFRDFRLNGTVESARLTITAIGVYEATLNGKRVGEFILAPGFTSYQYRLQVQEYDVTALLAENNRLMVYVGNGWAVGRMGFNPAFHRWNDRVALIAALEIVYEDGRRETITTDESWKTCPSPFLGSEIYDGEAYDARIAEEDEAIPADVYEYGHDMLIPQEGPEIREQERLRPVAVIHTPKGETLLDFGQNMAGYPEFTVDARDGDEILLEFGEELDEDGNFSNTNYRTSRPKLYYYCKEGRQSYKMQLCFQGFRYLRLTQWPEAEVRPEDFCAIVVHSEMKRTGHLECGNALLSRFYENVIWSQKSNYIDVPTDCPQRDERLGWMGDAQIFARTGALNFYIQQFMRKWLHDIRAEQLSDGNLPEIVPYFKNNIPSDYFWYGVSGWADAATIIPWELYRAYGDKSILAEMYDCMVGWVRYMHEHGSAEFLFDGGYQFADWLGLDNHPGSYRGATEKGLICSAYFAYSTELLIKAGRVLGRDVSAYEALYDKVVEAFRHKYIKDGLPTSDTQTACVLCLHFDLVCEQDRARMANRLVELLHDANDHMMTGFIGTGYLLQTLSEIGRADLAYTLVLHEDYPSWLYQVKAGATTVWEHCDGIRPDGTRWSDDMNSYNHYSFGAMISWVINNAVGINPDEEDPGYHHILFTPTPDSRLGWASASLDTAYGAVAAKWCYQGEKVSYEFTVPEGATATAYVDGKAIALVAGTHRF